MQLYYLGLSSKIEIYSNVDYFFCSGEIIGNKRVGVQILYTLTEKIFRIILLSLLNPILSFSAPRLSLGIHIYGQDSFIHSN